jgi:hypothetical protein
MWCLHPVQMPPAMSSGGGHICTPARYKCVAFVPGISPGTNARPHLYRMGFEPVQKTIFPVVFGCSYWRPWYSIGSNTKSTMVLHWVSIPILLFGWLCIDFLEFLEAFQFNSCLDVQIIWTEIWSEPCPKPVKLLPPSMERWSQAGPPSRGDVFGGRQGRGSVRAVHYYQNSFQLLSE